MAPIITTIEAFSHMPLKGNEKAILSLGIKLKFNKPPIIGFELFGHAEIATNFKYLSAKKNIASIISQAIFLI